MVSHLTVSQVLEHLIGTESCTSGGFFTSSAITVEIISVEKTDKENNNA